MSGFAPLFCGDETTSRRFLGALTAVRMILEACSPPDQKSWSSHTRASVGNVNVIPKRRHSPTQRAGHNVRESRSDSCVWNHVIPLGSLGKEVLHDGEAAPEQLRTPPFVSSPRVAIDSGYLPRLLQFLQTSIERRLGLGLPEPGRRDPLPLLDPLPAARVAHENVEGDPALGLRLLRSSQVTLRVLDLHELLLKFRDDQVTPVRLRPPRLPESVIRDRLFCEEPDGWADLTPLTFFQDDVRHLATFLRWDATKAVVSNLVDEGFNLLV